MNLKEEIQRESFKKLNGVTLPVSVLITSDAERIAEAYAKEKAWEMWNEFTLSISKATGYGVTQTESRHLFEKWWEENK